MTYWIIEKISENEHGKAEYTAYPLSGSEYNETEALKHYAMVARMKGTDNITLVKALNLRTKMAVREFNSDDEWIEE